jgi:hypothetical protein
MLMLFQKRVQIKRKFLYQLKNINKYFEYIRSFSGQNNFLWDCMFIKYASLDTQFYGRHHNQGISNRILSYWHQKDVLFPKNSEGLESAATKHCGAGHTWSLKGLPSSSKAAPSHIKIFIYSWMFLFLFLPCNCLLHHVEDYATLWHPLES